MSWGARGQHGIRARSQDQDIVGDNIISRGFDRLAVGEDVGYPSVEMIVKGSVFDGTVLVRAPASALVSEPRPPIPNADRKLCGLGVLTHSLGFR